MMVCGYNNSGYGYCGAGNYQRARSFLTKDEKIEILKEYQKDLEKEIQGVSERIKGLETSN
jgi:hypothetical protein